MLSVPWHQISYQTIWRFSGEGVEQWRDMQNSSLQWQSEGRAPAGPWADTIQSGPTKARKNMKE